MDDVERIKVLIYQYLLAQEAFLADQVEAAYQSWNKDISDVGNYLHWNELKFFEECFAGLEKEVFDILATFGV